jgi:GlpG protein
MRQAGTLPSKQDAERFADYLLTLGIGSKVDPAVDQWAIWILDENEVPRSKQELLQFLQQPHESRYLAAERDAKVARREAAERAKQAQKNYVDMRQRWSRSGRGSVTILLIGASVLVAMLTDMGHSMDPVGTDLKFWLPAIEQGQVWRLLTPIFLHAGPLHLIFNMWWLYDLGNMIEGRLGWWRFAALVLVIALASNFGQYVASGPNFAGMSGVVFGLFGYAWIRGRFDPTSGMFLRQDIVVLMMLWFGACLIGVVPNVANAAHGVGLAVGAALGYLPQIRRLLE